MIAPAAQEQARTELVRAQSFAELLPYIADADEAAELLRDVQARIRALEKARETVTRPLLEAQRATQALFRPALDCLELAKGQLKTRLAAEVAQRRELQHEAIAVGDISRALAVVAVPVSTRSVLRYRVVDPPLVPRAFLAVDERAVMTALRNGQPIPGIESYTEEVVIAR